MNKQISLEDVHGSVNTTKRKGWNKIFAFFGPAYLVSVGYMDPGNWATDIAGGASFGYTLIWVLLMSNLIALLLQSMSARLGIVSGRDLAQASRESYPPFVNYTLYFLAEVAIAACDLAEVLGMAIGLNLLFNIPIQMGVAITVLDTFLLLYLQRLGMRKMEMFIISLIVIIGLSFVVEMVYAQPSTTGILSGFVPYIPNEMALYIAIGIIGATVMPHNLYLHSALVQTRKIEPTKKGMWQAIKFNVIDSAIALNLALFVNAAILILAASTFYHVAPDVIKAITGRGEVADIMDAHKLLEPLLGQSLAPILFAVALIASGQSSTITGTLAGQIIMEGYLNLRIAPWMRRILTRMIAVVPALIVIQIMGDNATGELLVFSQVILSLQLGFAIIPLIHFVSNKVRMGEFAIPFWMKFFGWLSALVIVGLNVKLVIETLGSWFESLGENALILELIMIPLCIFFGIMLLYVTFQPFVLSFSIKKQRTPHNDILDFNEASILGKVYSRIAIAVDFSKSDEKTIQYALAQGGKEAHYLFVHILETAGALMVENEIADAESLEDIKNLEKYVGIVKGQGFEASYQLGYGRRIKEIPAIVNAFEADLLVMGAHGHKGFKDFIFGETINTVRHRIKVPLLAVK